MVAVGLILAFLVLWSSFPRLVTQDFKFGPPNAPSDGNYVNEVLGSREMKHQKSMDLLQRYLVPHLRVIEPPPGKKYHACMILIVRNELHLVEFLVRNLLAGVQMIFIVDDNRVRTHGICI